MKDLIYIDEPKILFGYNQKMEDPRDGLTLFGPIENNLPYGIMNGVVGTADGLRKFKKFIKSLKSPLYNSNNSTRPFFPGFETVFKAKWDAEKTILKKSQTQKLGN